MCRRSQGFTRAPGQRLTRSLEQTAATVDLQAAPGGAGRAWSGCRLALSSGTALKEQGNVSKASNTGIKIINQTYIVSCSRDSHDTPAGASR